MRSGRLDSHPVTQDKALNLEARVCVQSENARCVLSVHPPGRPGSIGRRVCCQRVVTATIPGAGLIPGCAGWSGAAPTTSAFAGGAGASAGSISATGPRPMRYADAASGDAPVFKGKGNSGRWLRVAGATDRPPIRAGAADSFRTSKKARRRGPSLLQRTGSRLLRLDELARLACDDLAAGDLGRVREGGLELVLAYPVGGDAGRLVGLVGGVEEAD